MRILLSLVGQTKTSNRDLQSHLVLPWSMLHSDCICRYPTVVTEYLLREEPTWLCKKYHLFKKAYRKAKYFVPRHHLIVHILLYSMQYQYHTSLKRLPFACKCSFMHTQQFSFVPLIFTKLESSFDKNQSQMHFLKTIFPPISFESF